MDATSTTAAEAVSFGRDHFGGCDFGDERLTRRAVTTADALLKHPAGTLPAKLTKAQLLGHYDFANNPKVRPEGVLAAHRRRTLEAARRCDGVVLFIHDTTEADFSGLDVAALGQIGNGNRRGLLVHNVLAVDWGRDEALGLAGQVVQARRKVPRNETLSQSRAHPQRESRLWVKGVEAVGPPPEGARWVNLMDRGGDGFESLDRQQRLGQLYLVRSRHNRNARVRDALGRVIPRKLHTWARKLEALGERGLTLQAQAGEAARECRVRVAAGPVQLPAPHVRYGEHGKDPLQAWVVRVWEPHPPPGAAAVEWLLLTNIPTATAEQAWERVDWYARRPTVEEFHKAQKTGCGMEQQQFTTRKALEVTLAMLSVVAVQLLRLRDLSRREDADRRPAAEVVDEVYVEVLSLWRFKEARALSVKDFMYALARLGGHLGRGRDRPPGWLVLWRGWMELQRLVEGAQLVRGKRSG